MTEMYIGAAGGGSFMAYVSKPATLPAPGVVVIQEIFGVNGAMRAVCDDLAMKGFLAVCPDLFWRQKPGIQLTDRTKEEWDQAFALMQGLDIDKAVDDLRATLDWTRQQTECTAKVGSVGYCLGGKLAFLMAARTDSDANVSYYGVGLADLLGEVPNITKPLLLHMAEKDRFVPADAREAVVAGVASNANITAHVYEGVDHAFARPGGEHFDKNAADLANSRSTDFLKSNLK